MKGRIILALTALFAANAVFAADTPSVQVETVALKQKMLSDTVSGYGVVSPDVHSLQNINLPRPGQIVSLWASIGQEVKRGAPLLEFKTGADAGLAYQQALQAVDFAKSELKRAEQLVSQQLATQSQLAAAEKALADAKAAWRAQEKIGADRSSEQVTAPFDGMVVALHAAQGDRLAAGASVLQLARKGVQRVQLGIEPEEAGQLRPGLAVTVIPVFSAERKALGRVERVAGMINPQTQFVDVLVDVPGSRLLPGTRVRAEIELSRRAMWVVPRSAVLSDDEGSYIFQIREGKARRVNVRTDLEREGLVAVEGAFDTGAPVVSLGNYELSDGMAVTEGRR